MDIMKMDLRELARQLRAIAARCDALAALEGSLQAPAPVAMPIPAGAIALADPVEPPWLIRARKDIGVRELPGHETHPRIAQYYEAVGLEHPGGDPQPAIDDSTTAWCSCAVACWMKEAGFPIPEQKGRPHFAAAARSWMSWGIPLPEPKLGCVVVFSRGDNVVQGHVALWLGFEGKFDDEVVCLGGNQANSVCIAHRPTLRVIGYRWPVLK